MTLKFIREAECHKITGLSRCTRWRLEKDGSFPARRQISPNTVGWLSTELDEWMQSRIDAAPSVSGKFSPKMTMVEAKGDSKMNEDITDQELLGSVKVYRGKSPAPHLFYCISEFILERDDLSDLEKSMIYVTMVDVSVRKLLNTNVHSELRTLLEKLHRFLAEALE